MIVDQLDKRQDLMQVLEGRERGDPAVFKRVSKIVVGNESFVIKEFFQPYGWWRLFTPNKGVRIWNMHKLVKDKVDVCQPIMLFYEKKKGHLYSGVVFQDEGISLNFLEKGIVSKQEIESLEKKMKREGVFHGDIKRSNLLVAKDESLKLIDLDGVCLFPQRSIIFYKMHRKDRKLFLQLATDFSCSDCESRGDIQGVLRP